MSDYIRRTLTCRNQRGELEQIDDLDIIESVGPVIVLGEPGMGKTRLMQQIACEPDWAFRSAASFVAHPDPARLTQDGSRLVIDGLDELPAAQESDPVYRVLGQLLKAGCPPFILSCRAADWRGAVARQDISAEYDAPPQEMTLDPFSREGAVEFLSQELGAARAEEVVYYLEGRGIPDLYGNPLTLSLFGEVASRDEPLPKTRADLLLRACEIMWNERSDRHDKSPLSALDQDTALAGAGAAFAALVLTASEAVSCRPSSAGQPRTIHATDLGTLPHGDTARALVGSRLFSAVHGQSNQFKPIHRAVAEFLGARWLCQAAAGNEARDRVLAMISLDGGVPASLRGIHAWLAQDERFAAEVIATDPYGVLRYGDPDALTLSQGREMLRALRVLQEKDPYFRAEDWARHSAKGLTYVEMKDDVRDVLLASETTFHLRTLLLEAVRGTRLSALLATDLEGLVLNDAGGRLCSFDERHEASLVLIAIDGESVDLDAIVAGLSEMDDAESTRLALRMMGEIGLGGFAPEQVARAILAHADRLHGVGDDDAHDPWGTLIGTSYDVPDKQIGPLLDAIGARRLTGGLEGTNDRREAVSTFMLRLVARQLELDAPQPDRLLGWLRAAPVFSGHPDESTSAIMEFIRCSTASRRAIQRQLIFGEHDRSSLWGRLLELGDVAKAWIPNADDAIYHLRDLGNSTTRIESDTESWRQLAAFGRRFPERAEEILRAARLFAAGNAGLEEFLAGLEAPVPEPEWAAEARTRRQRAERVDEGRRTKYREVLATNVNALRAGELGWIYPVAQAYLGMFRDLDARQSGVERVSSLVGDRLLSDALIGLEAVLGRDDLPTVDRIAASYAESVSWNIVLPVVAGIAERLRLGRGFEDIGSDVVLTARIAIEHSLLSGLDQATSQLDEWLRANPIQHERFARLLLEPWLESRQARVTGLYSFARDRNGRGLARKLAHEWLDRYPDLSDEVEIELIDVLVEAGEFHSLRGLATARRDHGYSGDTQRRNWLAIELLVARDTAIASFEAIGEEDRDIAWHLRHRLIGNKGETQQVSAMSSQVVSWIIRQLRILWPNTSRPSGATWGNTNPWDASQFLRSLITHLEKSLSEDAALELEALASEADDGYSPALRHAAEQQRQARREINFPGVTLARLKDVVTARAPRTSDDLLAVVRNALGRLQKVLRGNDTDSVVKFWHDDGDPRLENRCTSLLIDEIQRYLGHGIHCVPERDMPKGKRVDILFSVGDAALPVECKGQWNPDLWSAAKDQLNAYYLRDWRVQDRGLYLVYWFGGDVRSRLRLKRPPGEAPPPTTPEELRQRLVEQLAPGLRGSIAIEVLDLTR